MFGLVYLKLPWLGRGSTILANRASVCVKSCFLSPGHVLFLVLSPRFLRLRRMVSLQNSFVVYIYIYTYQCDADYIAWTNQRLVTRIAQHLSGNIRQGMSTCNSRLTQTSQDFSIGQHFLDNAEYSYTVVFHLGKAQSAKHLQS